MIPFADGFSLDALRALFSAYGIFAGFALGAFEEFAFFVPSTGFFIALGFFAIDPAASGGSALVAAIVSLGTPVSLGILAGGYAMYLIAYAGGKPLIMRFGGYARIRWGDIERLHAVFESRGSGVAALFFLRIAPAFPIGIVSLFCGLVRVPLRAFFLTTFFGSIPRVAFLSLVGWYLGKEYTRYSTAIASSERYFLLVALVFLLIVLVRYRFRSRRH